MTTISQMKRWRTRQIAATILYRICGRIRIEAVPDNYAYDLLVTHLDDNVVFGVKVATSTYMDTIAYRAYVEWLKKEFVPRKNDFKPIVLMCVNEHQETAQIGIQQAWMYNRAITIKKVRLHNATERIWPRFRDNINSMFDTIRSIAIENCYIVRNIGFEMHDIQGGVLFANAIYLRKISDTYKINRRDPETEQERKEALLNVIRQDEYPTDELDRVIEDALGRTFKNLHVQNRILLFTPDITQLQHDIDRFVVHANVLIEPFWGVGVIPPFDNINLTSIGINVYSTERQAIDYIRTQNLFVQHDITSYIPYSVTIEQLKMTMVRAEDVIV